MSAKQTALYRARHPERIKEYRSRPRVKERAAELMRIKRAGLNSEQRRGIAARQRIHRLRKYFGLTIEEYEAILEKQKGGCAICGSITSQGRWEHLHVDHDHNTGKVRGLLCTKCNRGIGLFDDDPNLLEKTAKYLRDASR
jgi:hypothetical protein